MEVRGPLKVHGRVEGDDPIASTEFTTKNYVDIRFSNFYNDLGSGASLTVQEEDGNPLVTGVSVIRFTNGSVTDNGGGDVSVSAGGGGGISDVDDGIRTASALTALGFNNQQFYISKSTTANKAVVNLRLETDVFQGQINQPILDNYFVVPSAQHNYTVNSAQVDCESGSATIGFYIVSLATRTLPGKFIQDMDNLPVSSLRRQFSAGSSAGHVNTMNVGDRLVLSIFVVAGAAHITYSVKLTRA